MVEQIGNAGASIRTEDRWRPGTILSLTFQQKYAQVESADSVTVQARIVQHTASGIEVSFMAQNKNDRASLERFLSKAASRLDRAAGNAGQSLIEYALIVPVLFFLIVNAVDFGGFIYGWLAVANAARSATDYAVMTGNSAGVTSAPTGAQVTNLFNSDVSALPNVTTTNPSVLVCKYNNGVTTRLAGTATCGAAPSDAEIIATGSTVKYITISVDVTYNYTPFIPTFTFPRMHIPFANPTAIHRQTVMRVE